MMKYNLISEVQYNYFQQMFQIKFGNVLDFQSIVNELFVKKIPIDNEQQKNRNKKIIQKETTIKHEPDM